MAKKLDFYVPAGGVLDHIDVITCLSKEAFCLQFLVCGKTGVGKSSLINSLVGCQACKVGDPGLSEGEEGLEGYTPAIATTWLNINRVCIAIHDSPGLQDSGMDDEKYLQDMYDKCKDVDLVLFCVDMTAPRYDAAHVRSAELLTKKFGEGFWKHCVFVMTKANMVRVPPSERGKDRAYHQRLYTNLLRKFREQLMTQGVSNATALAIPGVAAGYYDPDLDDADPQNERYVWYASDKARRSDQPVDFLSEIWVTCFETARRSAH